MSSLYKAVYHPINEGGLFRSQWRNGNHRSQVRSVSLSRTALSTYQNLRAPIVSSIHVHNSGSVTIGSELKIYFLPEGSACPSFMSLYSKSCTDCVCCWILCDHESEQPLRPSSSQISLPTLEHGLGSPAPSARSNHDNISQAFLSQRRISTRSSSPGRQKEHRSRHGRPCMNDLRNLHYSCIVCLLLVDFHAFRLKKPT